MKLLLCSIVYMFMLMQHLSAQTLPATAQLAGNQTQPALDSADDQDDPYDSMSFFMYGVNYLSNNVFLGRSDTMLIPYISPYVGYHLGFGLFAKAMVSYDPISRGGYAGHIDLTTIEGGYDHGFGDHFNTGILFDKYFYDKNSINVKSSSQGSGTVYGQYSNKWIEPTASFMTTINENSMDYNTSLLLDHNFALADNTLNIIPGAAMFAGTQNYYDEYFKKRLKKKDKKVKVDKVINDSKKYKPLDYEFSTQATYRVNKWLFSFTATYAIPVSPSVVKLPTETRTEKLTNKFFIELDICHR